MDRLYQLVYTPCAPLLSLFSSRGSNLSLTQKMEALDKKSEDKIDYLDISLAAIRQLIAEHKLIYEDPRSTSLQKAKAQRRLKELVQIFKKKESEQQSKIIQKGNLSAIAESHQNLSEASEAFVVMKEAQRDLQRVTKRFNHEDISKVRDDIQESLDLSNEVTDLLSSPLASTSAFTVDESTFDAELDEILGVSDHDRSFTSPYTENTSLVYPTPKEPISVPMASSFSSSSPFSSSSTLPLPN